MINLKEFEVLRNVAENKIKEKDDTIIKQLICKGLVSDKLTVTDNGEKLLAQYKVDNAIILAAGMSTRFVPVSYELPKGLISVKGEVLIERIIRQLHEAGVKEVVVVVGYMMEKFLYLREKYGVKLVVNNEYATKNTHSSIYAAQQYLGNTYICCSDNYYPENPFHEYEYHAYYCSIFLPGISYVERAFTFDEEGLIIDTNKPSHDQWIMFGHAYYDNNFTKSFVPILNSYYGRDGVEGMYWENVYAENLDKLFMHIKQCEDGEILEFDSMEELKQFDPDFIRHNKIKIFDNICKTLGCDIGDISDVETIKRGLNNRSFKFTCKGMDYIYRHPGNNAEGVIDRKKETVSLNKAKELGIDNTLIYIDENEGWKISKFVNVTEEFDFSNKSHIKLLAESLKKLHDAKVDVKFSFDYYEEACKLIDYVKKIDRAMYDQLIELKNKVEPVFEVLKKDRWQISLCHNDIYEPNLLIVGDKLELIDWEFAGNCDIGYDVCKLFTMHNPDIESVDDWLYDYYKRQTTKREKIHLFACASLIYFYWFVWSVYESKNDAKSTSYMMSWYDRMNYYTITTLSEIQKIEGDK